ncbi:IgaA [Klebsiella pneumoniae]|nr:IgaA [Klebsiella pneumoniae]
MIPASAPALRSAIQKSGMVLLDDFGDIVQKTNDLCSAKDDCLRLKNALVNLGNTRNWETLTKRATAGKLDGVNVLLRPVSAESLENLVTTSNRALCDTRNLAGRAGAEQPSSRRFSYRQR